jgi:hypothetical protein
MKIKASLHVCYSAVVMLLVGCGGLEPDPATQQFAMHISLAAESSVNGDLPSCTLQLAQQDLSGPDWQLQRHPFDAELAVISLKGCPVCIDFLEDAVKLIHLPQPSTVGMTMARTTNDSVSGPEQEATGDSSDYSMLNPTKGVTKQKTGYSRGEERADNPIPVDRQIAHSH